MLLFYICYTLEFWQHLTKVGGANPPEFLSTHPTDANRIQKIRTEIPEAMTYYRKSR